MFDSGSEVFSIQTNWSVSPLSQVIIMTIVQECGTFSIAVSGGNLYVLPPGHGLDKPKFVDFESGLQSRM